MGNRVVAFGLLLFISFFSPFAAPKNKILVNDLTQLLTLTCASKESDKNTHLPFITLKSNFIIGGWKNGQWTPQTTSDSAKLLSGFGSSSLLIKSIAYEVTSSFTVTANTKNITATYNKSKKTLYLTFPRAADLLQHFLKINLYQGNVIIARLSCENFSYKNLRKEKNSASIGIPRTPDYQEDRQTSSMRTTPTPIPTPTPKQKYCNTNSPTGLASCPAGQVRIGDGGTTTTPIADKSVKPGTICSDISIADANAKAVAEANARAAASLNCTYMTCGCYYTPSGSCPPNTKGPIGSPPTCQEGNCYYSFDSKADADAKCQASAAQIGVCAQYKPICIPLSTTTTTTSTTTTLPKPRPRASQSPSASSSP